MIDKNRMFFPGDKGWNEKYRYPWQRMRALARLPQVMPGDGKLEIHGFFVTDKRISPTIAIFKNCSFPLLPGTEPKIDELVPFSSVGEAFAHIKSLNLSQSEEMMFRIAALCPDPGIVGEMPDTIFVTKDELKK